MSRPDPIDQALHAGMADLQAGRFAQGVERLRAVLAARPQFAELWSNLGFALRAMGRTAEAREALERAVALNPAIADAWNLLGLVAQDERNVVQAEAHFERALRLKPDFAYALMNRANARQAAGRHEEALGDYARALQLAPSHAEIHYNLGHMHHKATGELDRAIAHYLDALRIEPRFALAHHNLSHALFLRANFGEAWSESAWRPTRQDYAAQLAALNRPYSLPARLAGARIAILAEQGLGDILFYLRYAPALRDCGVTLDFAGPERLHAMLGRTGLFDRLSSTPGELQGSHVPLLAGDIPLALQQETGSVSVAPPLGLAPERSRLDAMRRKLRALGPPPYIAIAWRSGEPRTGLFETLFKEISFEVLGTILRDKPGTLVSVQRQPIDGETAALGQALGRPVHDLSGVNPDLEEALALMAATEDYVGVSSTLVHLRAGLGAAGTVFVPFPWEWRWMAKGDSPWFPGVRVVRQRPDGWWDYG